MQNLVLMQKQFEILRANRILILKLIERLSLDQINKIPEGHKNRIAWNMAHLVVTHQLLCYKNSGLNILVTQEMVENYQKGTVPTNDMTQEELEYIKDQLLTLADSFEEDYKTNIFSEYKAYPTSLNVTLNTIDDAFQFNNYHEGIHLGIILSLKKHV
jgi:DNA-binding transcriptional MerR regulator